MQLYVFHNVFNSYHKGRAVALAESPIQAMSLIAQEYADTIFSTPDEWKQNYADAYNELKEAVYTEYSHEVGFVFRGCE